MGFCVVKCLGKIRLEMKELSIPIYTQFVSVLYIISGFPIIVSCYTDLYKRRQLFFSDTVTVSEKNHATIVEIIHRRRVKS